MTKCFPPLMRVRVSAADEKDWLNGGNSTAKEIEMTTNRDQIEAEIQAKGLNAPRITPDDINANIVSEHYFTAAEGLLGSGVAAGKIPSGYKLESPSSLHLLTFCVLVLQNGFTVTGESACASPENFDAEIGRKIARKNAVEKVWPLMGYELKSKLASK